MTTDNPATTQIHEPQGADISETRIREEMPEILDILLADRMASRSCRKKRNIIWANDNYIHYHKKHYAPGAEIRPEWITGKMGHLIMPRTLKPAELQKERTKSRAEVFTPAWVVKKQNDEIDQNYLDDDLETYVRRTWLEITCGEAPYMASRYDMITGKIMPLVERAGFVDRKLQRINDGTKKNQKTWQHLVTLAYQASYGFEWNGDSLLLARENLLYTCRDYYLAKWGRAIPYDFFKKIARIISYNVFQMDGISLAPLSSIKFSTDARIQLEMFQQKSIPPQAVKHHVQIMNWQTRKWENLDLGV